MYRISVYKGFFRRFLGGVPFIYCVVLFCFISVSQAQVSFGLRAGANIPYLIGRYDPGVLLNAFPEYIARAYDLSIKSSLGLGYHAGVVAYIPLAEGWVQPELLYSYMPSLVRLRSRSTLQDVGVPLPNSTRVRQFSYLSVPILYRYDLAWDLHVQVGPQVDFLIIQKGLYKTDGAPNQTLKRSNFNINRDNNGDGLVDEVVSSYRTFYFGLTGGVGWTTPFGLVAEVRYQWTFNRLYNQSLAAIQRLGSTHRLHNIALSVSYPLLQINRGEKLKVLPLIE